MRSMLGEPIRLWKPTLESVNKPGGRLDDASSRTDHVVEATGLLWEGLHPADRLIVGRVL
jgi:hypothetical protein